MSILTTPCVLYPENIPDEMKKLDQWVLYDLSKCPRQVNGRPAKCNAPTTWDTYKAVLEAYKAGGFAGIGFMFSKDDPFTFNDIDKCIVDGVLSPVAKKIVEDLDSYTEISPSGTGIHIFVKGKKPGESNKDKGKGLYECYDQKRYSTITGNIFDGKKKIVENQAGIDRYYRQYIEPPKATPLLTPAPLTQVPTTSPTSPNREGELLRIRKQLESLPGAVPDKFSNADLVRTLKKLPDLVLLSDKELLKIALRLDNGGKIKALLDVTSGKNLSTADGALAGHLAVYSLDEIQIERIFFNHHIGDRDKWRNRGENYRKPTIALALKNPSAGTYRPHKSPLCLTSPGKTKEIGEIDIANFRAEVPILWSGGWWVYTTGVWERQTLDGVNSLLYRTTGKIPTTANVRELKIQESQPVDMVTPQDTLCLNDCVYNLLTGEITDHSPEYHHTVKLPFKAPNLSPQPVPQLWEKFLKSVGMDNSEIKYLQQFTGYCLTPETRIQKGLMLLGETETGKDSLCAVLEALFGNLAISGSLQTLLGDKYNADLLGKTVILSPENDCMEPLPVSIYSLIAGGAMGVERKGRDRQQKRLASKIIMGTNDYFPSTRIGEYLRRWDIIKLKRESGSKNNLFLRDEIIAEELRAIFDWACRGLLDLVKNNYALPITYRQAEYQNEHKKAISTVANFVELSCSLGEDDSVKCSDLVVEYQDIIFPDKVGSAYFGRELTRAYPQIRRKKIQINNKREWHYFGIKLNQ